MGFKNLLKIFGRYFKRETKNKSPKPHVVITAIPKWFYGQYYILGLMMLAKRGEIRLSLKCGFPLWLFQHTNNKYTALLCKAIYCYSPFTNYKSVYNIDGYIITGSSRLYFTIDISDSPYTFKDEVLDELDCYFKVQCPIEFHKEGFHLNKSIVIPWTSYQHVDKKLDKYSNAEGERLPCKNLMKNLHKIKPLAGGMRQLYRYSYSYKALLKAYNHHLTSSHISATGKLMCYFGNSFGPTPQCTSENIDFDSEANLLAKYNNQINHPNEKRAKAAKIIESFGDGYDARVICTRDENGTSHTDSSLIIPINEFCHHIANFQYNLNISGFRMSIPNRFIESFMAGTAILTDKLSVKWYLPFEDEVIETVEMGYNMENEVDWPSFTRAVENLPNVDREKILKIFHKKWAPDVVASYLVKTVIDSAKITHEVDGES